MSVFRSNFFFLLFPGESILKQVLFFLVILHFMDCYCFGGIIQKLSAIQIICDLPKKRNLQLPRFGLLLLEIVPKHISLIKHTECKCFLINKENKESQRCNTHSKLQYLIKSCHKGYY